MTIVGLLPPVWDDGCLLVDGGCEGRRRPGDCPAGYSGRGHASCTCPAPARHLRPLPAANCMCSYMNNMPVDVMRGAMGVDSVIVVDVEGRDDMGESRGSSRREGLG